MTTQTVFIPDAMEQAFLDFHEANPRIYDWMVHFAFEAKGSGLKRCGIAALFERVRWYVTIDRLDRRESGFKLNNNHRAYYARMIMEREPALVGFFATRSQKTELIS